jgi:hypothetical protein
MLCPPLVPPRFALINLGRLSYLQYKFYQFIFHFIPSAGCKKHYEKMNNARTDRQPHSQCNIVRRTNWMEMRTDVWSCLASFIWFLSQWHCGETKEDYMYISVKNRIYTSKDAYHSMPWLSQQEWGTPTFRTFYCNVLMILQRPDFPFSYRCWPALKQQMKIRVNLSSLASSF